MTRPPEIVPISGKYALLYHKSAGRGTAPPLLLYIESAGGINYGTMPTSLWIPRPLLDHRSQSYGLRPEIEGFSHGLTNSPPDCLLHQSVDWCRPFKSALTNKKEHPSEWMGVLFWRRRRDLNPRNPFGVYTISNRARSASYATSPYRFKFIGRNRLAYNTT